MSVIDCYITPNLKSDLFKWTRVSQCFLFALLISPVLLLITAVTLICRLLVTIHFYLVHESKFSLCAPTDAAFAVESHANAITINGFVFVKGQTDIYKLREKLLGNFIGYKTKDGRQPYQKFTWKLLKMYGFYSWETSNDFFDIRDHVKLCPGMDCTTVYSEQEVLEATEKLLDNVLNSKYPQWEILYVPKVRLCNKTGHDNDQNLHYAIIFRSQHAYVDAISALQALRRGLCDEPGQLTIDPVNPPIPKVSNLQLIGLYVQTFFTAPYSYYKMISTTPKSVFQNMVENRGPKYLACTKAKITLESIKLIRSKFKCSTTALFNSMITGALRTAAKRKNIIPIPENVDVAYTLAVLPYQNEDPQNRFTIKIVQSPVSISDPVKRLLKINSEIKSITPSELLALHGVGIMIGLLPAMFISLIYKTAKCGCALTNLPGLKEKPRIDGNTVEEFYGCPPIKNGVGFGVGVCSHNGSVRALWMVEKSTLISSREDVNELVAGFEKEFFHLECIANANN